MTRSAALLLVIFSIAGLAACKKDKSGDAAAQASSADLTGIVWIAEDIGGEGVIDNSRVTIEFGEDGRVYGHSGCNRYTGDYETEGGTIVFPHAMASTRMACLAEALSNQEHKYLTKLSGVNAYEFTPEGALLLTTADGGKIKYMPESTETPD